MGRKSDRALGFVTLGSGRIRESFQIAGKDVDVRQQLIISVITGRIIGITCFKNFLESPSDPTAFDLMEL